MRPLGKLFDGSDSLFQTQQSLVNEAGNAAWLPHFTPTRIDHLHFVNHLFHTFCELDTSCAFNGIHPAYIAGVLTSYYRPRPVIGGLYIARTASTVLDNIYRKGHTFLIGAYQFRLTEWLEYEGFPDFPTNYITFEGMSVSFFSYRFKCL